MKKSMLNGLFVLTLLALVTETASAAPVFRVPDAGSTSLLLAGALGGLSMLRRYIR